MVLILTHPDDVHADAVQRHLDEARVPVCRTDTAELGRSRPVVAHFGGAAVAGTLAGCALSEVGCVWHRRPSEFAGDRDGDLTELRSGIGGILAGLPHLNHPADMALAGLKPYQLAAAGRAGLLVPETVVGTDPAAAAALEHRHGGEVVVKALSRGATRAVTARDRAGWSRPIHLTQQRIAKTHDIRLTIVDGELFAVRIDSTRLDWRDDPDGCRYRRVPVPATVAQSAGRLLAALRLRYAALDFAVDSAGRWWFLEVNPNGQWLWLEHATGAPIARAIAGALTTHH